MAEPREKEKGDANDYKLALTKVKGFVILALKHLESVSGEQIPPDKEFREILFTLLTGLIETVEHIDDMLKTLRIPNLD